MDRERLARIEAIFHEASALAGAARAEFLEQECGGDEELRQEVESLLAVSGETGELHRAIQEAAAEFTAGQHAGQHFGSYRLLRPVGHGGMGTVWLGERADGVHDRKVAIKFALGQVNSETFSERLRQERRILASLDHPNIARLLDGGSGADGTPYVVMEFVDGHPILDYCQERTLGLRERLELFLKLSSAVQYAHQSLVVHRDIKPSNVLVTSEGQPKLLDFGIAKLLEADDVTPTKTAARLMTADYASPEQIAGAGATTATDVYSLGVLLYELLVGENPFSIGTSNELEVIRRVCETEPREPSTAARHTARLFARQLSGDLDSIVLKALRKEPAERYSSVEQFAQDVQRFLDGYPVEARRGALAYRAQKFIRRNRATTALASILVVSLLGFGVGMALLARQAARERDAAEELSQFLVGTFSAPTPAYARGNTVTAREVLDRGAARVNRDLREKPALRARMLVTLGNSYLSLGITDRAVELGDQALRLYGTELEAGTADHAAALYFRGAASWNKESQRAQECLDESLRIRRRLLPAGDPLIAKTLGALGALARTRGDYETSERLGRESAEQLEKSLGPRHEDTITALSQLGTILRYRGKRVESTKVRRRTLEAASALFGRDHPSTVNAMSNLATDLAADGEYKESEQLLREVAAQTRKLYGESNRAVALMLGNLGAVLALSNQPAKAEAVFREVLELYRKNGLSESIDAGRALHNLSRTLLAQGDVTGAERLCRRAIAINTKMLGAQHPELGQYTDTLGILLRRQNRFLEGAEMHRKALAIRRAALRPGHPGIAVSLVGVGAALAEAGKAREAEPYLREALQIREAGMAPGQWEIAEARSALGQVLLMQQRYAEAEPLLSRAVTELEAKRGASSREAATARERLEQLGREWPQERASRR